MGDHLLSHWPNVDRTLTQSSRRSIFRTAATEFTQREDDNPHRHVTDTYRHVMEKHFRTDHQYKNSCTDLRRLENHVPKRMQLAQPDEPGEFCGLLEDDKTRAV